MWMATPTIRAALTVSVISLALLATPSPAVAPIIALLGKQLLQDMVMSTAKSMLMQHLSGLGCKGTALANAISSFGSLKGGATGLLGGMPSGAAALGGMPGLPAGMLGMPGVPGVPGMGGIAGVKGLGGMPGISGMPGMPGTSGMSGMPPEIAAQMARMMPGGGLDAAQLAEIADLQKTMGAPLSPLETVRAIDEMGELGLLSAATSAELKECMLVLPQTVPMMGMAMGMMKPMLPQLRDARSQMQALSPLEQDELAATLAQEFDTMPTADRKRMLTELGGGLFPPRVVESLTRRYGGP